MIGHVPPCSHDLCLFLFSCFSFYTITWPIEVIIVLWSFWPWSIHTTLSFYIFYFYFSSFLHHIITPIIPLKHKTYLQQDVTWTCPIKRRKILYIWRQTFIRVHEELPRAQRSFHQWSQYSGLDDVIRNPHWIKQGAAANSCQESCPDSILWLRHVWVGPTPTLW